MDVCRSIYQAAPSAVKYFSNVRFVPMQKLTPEPQSRYRLVGLDRLPSLTNNRVGSSMCLPHTYVEHSSSLTRVSCCLFSPLKASTACNCGRWCERWAVSILSWVALDLHAWNIFQRFDAGQSFVIGEVRPLKLTMLLFCRGFPTKYSHVTSLRAVGCAQYSASFRSSLRIQKSTHLLFGA